MNYSTNHSKRFSLLMRIVFSFALFAIFAFGSSQTNAQSYCTPYYYYSYYGYIQVFQFNGINNPNYTYNYYGGYTDYSSSYISNNCTPGQTYSFSLTGYSIWGNYCGVSIWVDWNNNGSLTDAGEQVYTTSSSPCATSVSGNITVPATASTGNHRMRVLFAGYWYYFYYYGYWNNPCNAYWYYAEVEDYTIKVAGGNDAGITAITSPPKSGYRYTTPQNVTATLKNFSNLYHLQSCTINWSVNGVTQTAYNWSGDIDTSGTLSVTIGTFTFQPAAPWDSSTIKVWTTNPKGNNAQANTMPDMNPANDSKSSNTICIMNDAGFVNADAMIPITPGFNNVILGIHNYAPKPLSTCSINWWVNWQQPATQYFWPGTGGPIMKDSTMNINTGQQYSFGGGNVAYNITAQTINPNGYQDDFTANDSGTVQVYKALPGGTYTIGTNNSDFVTLQSFVDFVNFWGLAGPVTILFRPGTYVGGQVISPRGGGKFPMTFGSVTGSNYDVNLTACNTYVFDLKGLSNMAFKNLTFTSTCCSTYGTLIQMEGGNSNVSVTNCVFNGCSNAPTAGNGYEIIYAKNDMMSNITITDNVFNGGSEAISLNSIPGSNNYKILRNSISNPSRAGITLNGSGATGLDIESNSVYGTSFWHGIYAVGAGLIKDNRISGVTDASDNYDDAAGIHFDLMFPMESNVDSNSVQGTNANGIDFNSNGAQVDLNANIINLTGQSKITSKFDRAAIRSIYDYSEGSTPFIINRNSIIVNGENGIDLNNASGSIAYNKIIVSSFNCANMSGLKLSNASGYVTDNMVAASNAYAATLNNTDGALLYYNTFYNNSANLPTFMYTGSVDPTIKRNIFFNAGMGTAYNLNSVNTPTGWMSDKNDYYSAGVATGKPLAIVNGTSIPDLTTLKTKLGTDANSVSEIVYFMSTTDLRITQLDATLYTGTPTSDFNQIQSDMYQKFDFYGNPRTQQFYMGCFEINPTIAIKDQPQQIVNCDATANQMFIVVSTIDYGGTLTYQWQKDGVDINGATNAILPFGPLTHDMVGVYHCKIQGNGGAAPIQTQDVLLYTLESTKITRQPDNAMVDLGETAHFDLDVHVYQNDPQGYQPNVQWYRGTVALVDNDRISGSQSSILTIRDIKPTDYDNNYSVVISGLCGADQSTPISISAKPQITIATQPDTMVSICEGLSTNISVSATVNMQNITMNYQWRYNSVPIDDDGHYMGTKTPNLLITKVMATDGGNYDCVITLTKGADIQTTTPCNLQVKLLPAIITHPVANITLKKGDSLSIGFNVQGQQPLYFSWFKDGQPTGDSTQTFTKSNIDLTDAGEYMCHVWNECGEIWTKPCGVTINQTIYMGVDDVMAGGYTLLQNQPNPFSNTTTIGIVAPQAGDIKLTISDIYGRELKSYNLKVDQGLNNFNIDATDMNSGVYYYNLTVDSFQASRKMIIVK